MDRLARSSFSSTVVGPAIAVLIGAGFNAATRIVWPRAEEPLMPRVDSFDGGARGAGVPAHLVLEALGEAYSSSFMVAPQIG